MRTICILACTLSALAFTACGGGGTEPTIMPDAHTATHPDANVLPAPDANSTSAANLGQVCDPNVATSCPTGNTCVIIGGVGSQTMGYCSPTCYGQTDTATCSNQYTGPATGQEQCAVTSTQGGNPDLCVIVCQATTDCPTGLTCTPVPGQPQPVSICVVAA